MEAVIIPWQHILSEDHSKAMQLVRNLRKDSAVVIEAQPERVSEGYRRKLRFHLANFNPTNSREILEELRIAALYEALSLLKLKKVDLQGIDSEEINRRFRAIMGTGLMTRIEDSIKILKLDIEREKFFTEKIQEILASKNKVYALIGQTHAEQVAERLRKEGVRVEIADTQSKQSREYCRQRDYLKTKIIEGRGPTDNELIAISERLQKDTKAWINDREQLAKLEQIKRKLKGIKAKPVSRKGKPKRKKRPRKSKKR